MFRVKTIALAGAAILAAMSASAASATVYLFDLSGSKSAAFSIDTAVPPAFTSTSSLIGDQIRYDNVAGSFGGAPGIGSIGFGTGLVAGFQISGTSLGFAQFVSPDLFTGPLTSPVFNLGTFNLTSIFAGASTLRISRAATPGAVPEPATWMMMLAGFALTGAAMRRRRPLLAAA